MRTVPVAWWRGLYADGDLLKIHESSSSDDRLRQQAATDALHRLLCEEVAAEYQKLPWYRRWFMNKRRWVSLVAPAVRRVSETNTVKHFVKVWGLPEESPTFWKLCWPPWLDDAY